MIFEERWYQNEAEFSIYDYFNSGKEGNPIVAMPTGTGKAVVIAKFINNILKYWPNQRIMMLTHVKELISQNAEKLLNVWPTAPLGIYSAGLNSRDMVLPIVFGGIQSVSKAIEKSNREEHLKPHHLRHFGWRDLILIDECHLLSPNEDTMYQQTINDLKTINPKLKVIGFSATPYRLKQGKLTDEGLFTDVCYDLTQMDKFNRLIDEGYLATLIPRPTDTKIDLSGVRIVGSEFNSKDLEKAVDTDEITYSAVKEMVQYGADRKAWIVFASGIDNSEHINSMLQSFGINSTTVHSKLPSKENDKRLKDYKNGEYLAIVSNLKLTTGFDHPPIDFIGHLMPTLSPGKWVQTLGRGTRPAPGKANCLVMDFAGNTKRLGPINDPVMPSKPGKKKAGDVPIKICDSCGVYNHASVRFCISCANEFVFKVKITETAYTGELIKTNQQDEFAIVEVQKVIYNLYEKKDKEGTLKAPPSIKVSYFCGLKMYSEWVCLEHSGFASKKARDWWRRRHYEEAPPTTYLALKRVNELKMPTRIKVIVNRKYPEIVDYEL